MHASPALHPRADERSLRRDAEALLLRSGARLIDLLHRIAGEDGLALGFAFRDIVMNREMTPASWPIEDVLDLLAEADVDHRSLAAWLQAALSSPLVRIEGAEEEPWADAAEPATGAMRAAA